jgi:hypothetical protein
MFGPLPALHRWVLIVSALVVGIGMGVWLGVTPAIAMNVRVGLVAGAAVGLAAAFALVHDFHQRQAGPARVRRRWH